MDKKCRNQMRLISLIKHLNRAEMEQLISFTEGYEAGRHFLACYNYNEQQSRHHLTML